MSDLISRKALLEEIKENHWGWFSREMLLLMLENQPTVEAKEVVHAKWEECAWVEFDGIHCGVYTYPNGDLACSNCHHAFKKELLCPDNFCPNCGADMRNSAE